MTDTIVILGKRSVRKTEVPALQVFGKAMAARGKQLVTTRTEGAAAIVAKAYEDAGGTTVYMTGANYKQHIEQHPVIAFTDSTYQQQLDEKQPGWRELGWEVFHNPKATQEAAAYLTQLMKDLGTPIEVSP